MERCLGLPTGSSAGAPEQLESVWCNRANRENPGGSGKPERSNYPWRRRAPPWANCSSATNCCEPIVGRAQAGMAVFGTCTGLILLAREIEQSDQPRLGLLDMTVRRNTFGRQVDSFETDLPIPALGPEPFRAYSSGRRKCSGWSGCRGIGPLPRAQSTCQTEQISGGGISPRVDLGLPLAPVLFRRMLFRGVT